MFASARRSTFLFVILAALLLSACASTQTVKLDSLRPAEITFPAQVQKILIIERVAKGDRPFSRIESIVTGEFMNEDLSGTQALIHELDRRIVNAGRFDVQVAEEMYPGLGLGTTFPDALSWGKIEDLCKMYEADVALVLEIYDTDFVVTNGTRVKDKDDKKTVEYTAQGVAHVTIGFRVYDPISQKIVDQKLFERTDRWSHAGANLADAIAGLINKKSATRQLSTVVGSMYAKRISPTPITLTRSFRGSYKKVPQLERGTRYAEVGMWDKAIEVWESALDTADEEGAGYLSYNIAIAHEVLGDFNGARRWAERSYTDYGYREARSYVTFLDRRQDNEALAREQYD